MDGVEIVVLGERDAVGPAIRTRRPLTGKALEEAKRLLAERAETAKLAEEYRRKLANGELTLSPDCIIVDSDIVVLDESNSVKDQRRPPTSNENPDDSPT